VQNVGLDKSLATHDTVAVAATTEATAAATTEAAATAAATTEAAAAAAAAPPLVGIDMLLDTDNLPRKQQMSCHRRDISSFLKLAGNLKAWQQVAKSVQLGKVVFLHGPHGCGKTAGVHDLATGHLGMRVYEINPGNTEGLETFTRDVRHVTRVKTLLGPRLVLIDDIEGFDECYVKAALTMVKEHSAEDSSIVFTSSDMYDRRIAAFRGIDNVTYIRMYCPSVKNVVASVRASSLSNASSALIESLASQTGGNFHQLLLRLRLHIASQPDVHVNLFKTTDLLLRGEASVDTWIRAAETHSLTLLLYENAPDISVSCDGSTALDRLADFYEVFSGAQFFPEHESVYVSGFAARSFLRTTAVPIMRVPPRGANGYRSAQGKRSEHFRDYP
jgi:hypothetical protein